MSAGDEMSLDPDAPPLHLRPAMMVWVAAGGALGAPARYAIGVWGAGWVHPWPWSTWTINVAGAFALGVVLEALARPGPDDRWRLRIRLLLGTGFLGTFTTYSSLAVDADLLVRAGRGWAGVGYVAASIAAGVLAVAAGVGCAHLLTTRTEDVRS